MSRVVVIVFYAEHASYDQTHFFLSFFLRLQLKRRHIKCMPQENNISRRHHHRKKTTFGRLSLIRIQKSSRDKKILLLPRSSVSPILNDQTATHQTTSTDRRRRRRYKLLSSSSSSQKISSSVHQERVLHFTNRVL